MHRRALLAAIAGTAALPQAGWALPPPPRELHLVNAHTGEEFRGCYRDDDGLIPASMDRLSEFLRDFHCGARIAIDPALLDFLAAVMNATDQPTGIVLSAYRTLATNARLARTHFGVAENSQHIYGRAIDIRFNSRLAEAVHAARHLQRGGVGWYPDSGFIHIDSGPVRSWELDGNGFGTLLVGRHTIPFDERGNIRTSGLRHQPLTPGERQAALVSQRIARLRAIARAAYQR